MFLPQCNFLATFLPLETANWNYLFRQYWINGCWTIDFVRSSKKNVYVSVNGVYPQFNEWFMVNYMGLWGSIFSDTKIWCSHHVLIAPETNKQRTGTLELSPSCGSRFSGICWVELKFLWQIISLMFRGPRYFNTAVFLTHCWPGGRAFFGFMADFSSILPDAPRSGSGRNASPAGSVAWLSTDRGEARPWVTMSSRRWKSFGDLWNCYTIKYIYIYCI